MSWQHDMDGDEWPNPPRDEPRPVAKKRTCPACRCLVIEPIALVADEHMAEARADERAKVLAEVESRLIDTYGCLSHAQEAIIAELRGAR